MDEAPPAESAAARTVVVWLAGDNNLSSEVPRKISALAEGYRAAGEPDTRLLVFSDRRDNYPQLIEIGAEGELKTVYTYPSLNSASAETFNRLITEMLRLAPAKSYGLIVFSHATGWLPQGALEHPTDFKSATGPARVIFDDNGTQMGASDFANHLPTPPEGKWEYIVFENCFTAGIEMAYDLRHKAERIVVSSAEILSPGFEHIYHTSLKSLLEPTPDLRGFANEYFNYRNSMSGNNRSATISVINTASIDNLAALSNEIEKSTVAPDESILPSLQRFNRHEYTLFFDLKEYLETRSPEKSPAISAAIDAAVEFAACTDSFIPGYNNGFEIRRHCGLTTYIPQSAFPDLNEEYRHTGWYRRITSQ